jgi:undecaprenyl diphosphate synthase
MEITSKNNSLILNICFAYDSDYEIQQSIKHNHKDIKSHLMIQDFPDLLVRTSGELRLSNFLTF